MVKPPSGGKQPPRPEEYPLPPGTARAFKAMDPNRPQNAGLVFDRFMPDWYDEPTRKKAGLERVRQAAGQADTELLRAWNLRWEKAVQAAQARSFSLKTAWRFVAGLGRKGPLEVGFSFHRYGFPTLPGSSVKGVARAWGLWELARKLPAYGLNELAELVAADGEPESESRKKFEAWYNQLPADVQPLVADFRAIFGTTAAAGRVIFFDAIPARLPVLDVDVMNPHYPNYYGGSEPPTAWQSPVPVYFLTVAPGTEFRFAVGWRGRPNNETGWLLDLAIKWLKSGLQELGAGAKTGAGYGYFVVTPADEGSAQPPVATTAEPARPQAQPEALTWRTGTVRQYRPDKGIGWLIDEETGEDLQFERTAIEERGWSPKKGSQVQYALVEHDGGRRVIKVRKV